MSELPIRLVCFDLGGVIVRIHRSWREACAAAGLPEPPAEIDPSQPQCAALIHEHQTGRITVEDYAREFCRLFNGGMSHRDVVAVHDAWILGEYEGVADVIDSIHKAGFETAALSNTTAEHWQQLLEYPSIARLRHRWASHLLGFAKPDREIYRAFEERVGFTGGEILFFDDLEPNIASAREIGWRAVHVDYTGSTAEQIAAALAQHGVAFE